MIKLPEQNNEFYNSVADCLDRIIYTHYWQDSKPNWIKNSLSRDEFTQRLKNELLTLQESHNFDLEQTVEALSGKADLYTSIALEFENIRKGYESKRFLTSMISGVAAGLSLGLMFNQASPYYITLISGGVGLIVYTICLAKDGFFKRQYNKLRGSYKPERGNRLIMTYKQYPALEDEYISKTKDFVRQQLSNI